MEYKLYVGNLPYDVIEKDLQDLFAPAGEVKEVILIKDRGTGRGKGFGFVEMGSQSDMEKAIRMFSNQEWKGRKLTVNIARPREERDNSSKSARY